MHYCSKWNYFKYCVLFCKYWRIFSDAPAKAFIKCASLLNDYRYNGCGYCVQSGSFHGRVVFDEIDSCERKDELLLSCAQHCEVHFFSNMHFLYQNDVKFSIRLYTSGLFETLSKNAVLVD